MQKQEFEQLRHSFGLIWNMESMAWTLEKGFTPEQVMKVFTRNDNMSSYK